MYLSFFYHRDDKIFVFGSWMGQEFSDNTKYLFIHCILKKYNAERFECAFCKL